MAAVPPTRYAVRDGAHIAYQDTGGEGPALLYVTQPALPIDLLWDDPLAAHGLRRLGERGRLIVSELRGSGSSDALDVGALPPMESGMDDLGAVLDAAGAESTAIFAASEASLPTLLFAATYPGRVRALVLVNPFARFLRGPETPWGLPERSVERYLSEYLRRTGTGELADLLAPSRSEDPAFRRWYARSERLGAGPATMVALYEVFLRSDALRVLPAIQAPTLVVVREGARHVRSAHGRLVAERIPDARLVVLPGEDTYWFGSDVDDLLEHVDGFLGAGAPAVRRGSRVLATVLFTDIVDSTRRAAAMGDAAWAGLLRRHDELAAAHVSAFRGRLVKSTGDGALATFDGPARAIQCARRLVDAAEGMGLTLRAGLHTGEVEQLGEDIGGLGVHIGARIAAMAGPGEVLVSGAVPALVAGSGIHFEERGSHELKGVPERWPVLAVAG